MAIIGDCDYWSYPSGRFKRLYTNGCVVNSGTGLMGLCKNLPIVVGANGTSLGAIGKINCEIEIGRKRFKETFVVCENLTRSLILGVDFAKQHAAGVHWTKHNFFVLTIDGETVAETKKLHNKGSSVTEKENKTPTKKRCSSSCGHQHHQHRQSPACPR